MKNVKLLQLLESVLGKGKPTSGNNIAFFSPFVSHYKPKLEIDIQTNHNGENAWHCWISDKKGRSIATLFKQLNLPKEKFEQLNRIIESSRYRVNATVVEKQIVLQLPEQYRPLWIEKKTPDYRNAIHYLKQRGVTIFDILKYRIGYCESGEYTGKIIIPSYDANGQLNYFVSRAFYKSDTQRHKNPKVSKDIIGFELFINWDLPIILCEGPFDAMAIKRNVVPLFGKNIQSNLMKKIVTSKVQKIYIALDNDAISKALGFCEQLLDIGKEVYLVELQGKDPSDMGFENFTKLVQTVSPLTQYKLMEKKLSII